MKFKNIFIQLDIFTQCRKYGFFLWQCPQFLFLIMGIIIIGSVIFSYIIGARYIEDPAIVALIVLILTAILFIIVFIINRSFERIAEVNRMKSEFISIVSHQLRSPLSNLKWTIEFLMSGRLEEFKEKQIEYFRILKENTDRMGELVSNLLIVSKIETFKLPFKKKEIFLPDLIKELIFENKSFAEASNVKIKFEFQKKLPKILIDPFQIRQVIENLLNNAIRYIKDRGEVKILLEKKNKNFYFEIKDNGVGIPKEEQKFIFQKFFRSENILRYQTQGSGLGLYICKAIIKKMGGKIGFKSEENKGSTFWFTLPVNNHKSFS